MDKSELETFTITIGNTDTISGSTDAMSGDTIVDLSGYGAQPTYTVDTITLDNIDWNSMNSTVSTSGSGTSGITWTDNTNGYPSYTFAPSDPRVNIDADGVKIKEGGDLKIGDRSMKEFMDKIEDQLAILRPAPELEEKWDKLKELRRQYEECKQDILEKEKIMEILKRDD